jgi:anti-sigma-K factor RskA
MSASLRTGLPTTSSRLVLPPSLKLRRTAVARSAEAGRQAQDEREQSLSHPFDGERRRVSVGVHEQFADQPALYALGALPASDKAAFEAHLTTCAVCAAEVHGFAPVLEALATTTAESAPSPHIRSALLSRIRTPRKLEATWLALAASAFLAVSLAWYAASARARVTALEAQLSVLAAPDTARVDLAGQPAAPAASARVFWSRSRGLVFTASNLPALPAGRVYQLWVLTDQPAPISAGLLTPDLDGRVTAVFHTSPDVPRPVAMAVTLEPHGGVLSPTGDKYLVGLAN